MLKIRLYKHCRLNDKYEEVFSLGKKTGETLSILEKYLATRTSEYFELNSTYYENEGTLVIDYNISSNNIYEFNYMKIIKTDENDVIELIRYCFIKDIKVKNGCVYLDYEEDIWSSYADKITNVINSILCNTRVKNYPNLTPQILTIPYEYNGNNKLDFTDYNPNKGNVRIIVEVQYYDLVSAEVRYQGRSVDFFEFFRYSVSGNNVEKLDAPFSIFQAIQFCNELILSIQNGRMLNGNTIPESVSDIIFNGKSFEIGNIYLIPTMFGSIIPSLASDTTNIFFSDTSLISIEPSTLLFGYAKRLAGKYNLIDENFGSVYENELLNDYKMLSFGNFSKVIDVINNGNSHSLRVDYIKTRCDFGLYLNFDNKIIEITDTYLYSPPFNALTSAETYQRAMAYHLKWLGNLKSITNGMFALGKIPFQILQGMGKIGGGDNENNLYSGLGKMGEGLMSSANNAVNGLFYGNVQQMMIDAKAYSNTKGIYENHLNIINSYYGLLKFDINPDNDNFVETCINKYGYNTYEFIKSISVLKLEDVDYFSLLNITNNALRFLNCNLYGDFPKSIADKLNTIFNNGFRIWYDELTREDDYAV